MFARDTKRVRQTQARHVTSQHCCANCTYAATTPPRKCDIVGKVEERGEEAPRMVAKLGRLSRNKKKKISHNWVQSSSFEFRKPRTQ